MQEMILYSKPTTFHGLQGGRTIQIMVKILKSNMHHVFLKHINVVSIIIVKLL